MRISELVNKNLIEVNLKSRTKEAVLSEIVDWGIVFELILTCAIIYIPFFQKIFI